MTVSLNVTLPVAGTAQNGRQSFRLTALDHYREPRPGATVTVTLRAPIGTLEHDGVLGTQVHLLTDDAGAALFRWSPLPRDEATTDSAVAVVIANQDPLAIDLIVEPLVELFWI